jgi:parvulin-like peptidyl-prolyl isomerase
VGLNAHNFNLPQARVRLDCSRSRMKLSCTIMRLGAAAAFLCGFSAQAELANAIKAIVNDAVITSQEVDSLNEQTADLLVRQYRSEPSMLERKLTEMQSQNLDSLVERQLILHEFKTAGYSLPESVLDELVDETIKNDFGDRATCTKTLEARGMSIEKFRQQIRERFIVAQLRLKNVSSEIIISPHKVETYYLAHRDEFKEEDRVKLRRITLNKSSDPNDPKAKEMADEILSRLKDGASFAELAAMYSQGNQESREGVWYDRSALRRELAETAFSLKPGQCSGVIETARECYVLMVDEISTAHYKTLGEVRDVIEKNLLSDERRRLEKQWIDRLKKKTFVEYF